MYPILDKINTIKDLRKLDPSKLSTLSEEIRDYIIEVVSHNGGHLAPSLGVVELTIALHRGM
jgi:1-deoxy-D-xylulose-5-phosphate synthase